MKQQLFTIVLLFLSLSSFTQPAFPGAEGFGSTTPGGRGGAVLFVTNLNNSGEGSFRAACAASGPRTIIFRVGGIIDLQTDVAINNPFVTIAGQTAPGDGICIKGAALRVQTHDVIVRGLRIRVGDGPGPDPDNRDAIGIANNNQHPYNIIIDHCSFSWAIDETVQIWYPCRDITVQWCIISESLHNSLHPKGAHGTGLLIGDHAKNISAHHNLLAHNNGRNPMIKENSESEFINNVVYNWGTWEASAIGNWGNLDYPILSNVIANYYKLGPNNSSRKPVNLSTPLYYKPGTKVYVKDNIGPGRMTNDIDDWALVNGDVKWRVNEPAFPLSNVTISNAMEAFHQVLKYAGVIAPKRDTVDKRVIQHVLDGTGKIIDSQMDVGGWPFYFSATPPLDMDNDGIPDYWEIANGLDRNNPSDANLKTLCPNGWYTNIEMYINSLITDLTTHVSNIPFQTKALSDMGNYPNPFKYSTEINFGLAINSNVTISVMDTMGKEIYRLIDNEPFLRGNHEVSMQRGTLSSGIYFVQIKAGNNITSSKIMVYN